MCVYIYRLHIICVRKIEKTGNAGERLKIEQSDQRKILKMVAFKGSPEVRAGGSRVREPCLRRRGW